MNLNLKEGKKRESGGGGEEGGGVDVKKKWIKTLRAKSEGCFIVIHSRSSRFPFCLTGNENLFTLGSSVAAYFILFYFIFFNHFPGAEKEGLRSRDSHPGP